MQQIKRTKQNLTKLIDISANIYLLFFQAVKGSGKMRFNKNELTRLAAQPSHKFEKEGVLFIKEKQEGFFLRKSECKLLFYLI